MHKLTLTAFDALCPSVVAIRSTLLEPRTPANATREFAGIVGGALGTREGGRRIGCTNNSRGCCRALGCCCAHAGIGERHTYNRDQLSPNHLTRAGAQIFIFQLTLAALDALSPSVVKVFTKLSTVLKPRTSASATRDLAGLVGAALGARDRGRS